MFQVLAFVYENYWGGDSCPELPALKRKLNAVGFDDHEVLTALLWLEDLKSAARRLKPDLHTLAHPQQLVNAPDRLAPIASSTMRVLTPAEQDHLGAQSWGWVTFLSNMGVLPPDRFELVMERAMAAPGEPVSPEDIKLIVLMVFWSLSEEPDALVLDELCDHRDFRLAN